MNPRRKLLGLVAVGALLAGGLGGPVAAGHGGRSVRVHGSLSSAEPVLLPPACDDVGHCVAHASSVNTWSGGLSGTAELRYILALDQGTGVASFESFELFTGHVDGCGHGSMILAGEITRPLQSAGTGSLEVLRGSGTGDLAGIAGRGTVEVTPTGPVTATSTYRLRLSC